MKCKICGGTGTSNTCVNGTFKPCSFCGGTGEVKDNLCETCGTICPFDDEHLECDNYTPLTNEEWLRMATTEELVQAIHLMTTCCYVCGKEGVDYKRCYFRKNCTGPKEIAEWLKEEHK